MTDTWEDIQAVKIKRNSLRERLEQRKKKRQDILASNIPNSGSPNSSLKSVSLDSISIDDKSFGSLLTWGSCEIDTVTEKIFLQTLQELILPCNSKQISERIEKIHKRVVTNDVVHFLIQKYSNQQVINVQDVSIDNEAGFEIIMIDQSKVTNLYNDFNEMNMTSVKPEESGKRKYEDEDEGETKPLESKIKIEKVEKKLNKEKSTNCPTSDIMSLLSLPSTKEKQSKQVGVEILELLSKPTAKERSLAEKFRSQGGAQVMEFCPYGTKTECEKMRQQEEEEERKAAIAAEENGKEATTEEGEITDESPVKKAPEPPTPTPKCTKLHFKKIIQSHTDESLGDCSFLNTCFHMESCKYVHYEVDTFMGPTVNQVDKTGVAQKKVPDQGAILYPPQWIQCDLRYLDMSTLGKFAVIMADPPWDIHMELPYGTMSDDEMRQLGVPALQDDGLIFLWVTGRAMELGRECLKLWGYERVDELIWVKTNQLQRIIRTGRTGHWLNHGKEHCLVGMKGNPPNLNRGLDCDVIVAEVRATSHKPDEIYGLIERLSPGTRKIELFGRQHNCNPNWITLGNQLDGIRLVDPELISSFQKRYPDGNCMAPAKK